LTLLSDMMDVNVMPVLLAGNRLWHVQVHRQQHDVEDVLRHTELRSAGGAADSRDGVVHEGRRLLESWRHLVHLVDAVSHHIPQLLSANFKITTKRE